MSNAFNDLALIVFTTLAPAGVVAFLCVGMFLLTRPTFEAHHERLNHLLAIILLCTWIGFIASATHLGTPANALHVIWGVGRSPLSNEVATSVVFLFLSGMYWMYTFKVEYSIPLAKILMFLSVISGIVMLYFTSWAYNVPTVVSWDSWMSPVQLLINALFSGTALAVFVLFVARCDARMWPWVLIVITMVALVASTVFGFAHIRFLSHVANNIATAISGFPQYTAFMVVRLLVGTMGTMLVVLGMQVRISFNRGVIYAGIGVMLILLAAFAMRYPFYMTYMSIGF